MHEAAAAVAGGSIRAMEAILGGDVEHAFHPGGGLHHAMPERASGFCIYDDPALAIARARQDGLRVLYVDLDVHHGDGVQAIHWSDPGVLTLSFHETGRYLFPGTGGVGELGEGVAAGTAVNVPLEPGTGEGPWLAAVRTLLPELAAAFGPDVIVSQHGADSHAWDPLAHLRVTTTAMGAAARLVDRRRPPIRRRPLAGDRWRRLRRLSRRAPVVEPRLAGRGASRGARAPSRRPGASDGPTRRCATGRRRCPTRSSTRRTPASRSMPRRPRPRHARRRSRPSSDASSFRGCCARLGIGDGGTRSASAARGPAPGPRRSTRTSTATVIPSIDREAWDRLTLAQRRRRAGRPSRRARPDRRRSGRWAPGDGGRRGHDGGRRRRLAGGGRPGTGDAPRARRGPGTATPGPRHQAARDARVGRRVGCGRVRRRGDRRGTRSARAARRRRPVARSPDGSSSGAGFQVSQAEAAVRAADPAAIAGIRLAGSGRA